MHHAVNAAVKTVDSITHPPILRIALACFGISLLVMIVFVVSMTSLAAAITLQQEWLDWAVAILSGAGAVIAAWFLFPVTIPIIAGLFEDSILKRVEAKDYPNVPEPQPQPFFPNLWEDVRFAGKVLGLNLLCLPLYLIPLVNLVIYYLLNGYLFGSEFFGIAAGRHIGKKQARLLRKQHGQKIFFGGVIIAFAATLPIVNLFVPFLGMAMMAHLYHKLKPADEAQP